jgi:hypothetical protein
MMRVAKCQSDSLAKCQCSTGFDEGLEKWELDCSPLMGGVDWSDVHAHEADG